ncbi:acidic endochitinase-like [Coffea eugenioides]|uniref:acidic endochitinase-like n=1 Tax=Coffea eugenioides TaxID=49369 RepID=UPI000F61154E|nr:acidic endochitinase-like [Coffea eugenioides]
MAASLQPLFSAITFLLLIASLIGPSEAAGIVRYWGRGHDEPSSLAEFCRQEFATDVNIAFLEDFGGGRMPELNISHPLPSASDIESCQKHQTKVFISIAGQPSLSSVEDAEEVAAYVWDTYLGGKSSDRPFGKAVLDGVELHIHSGNTTYLDDLARALKGYSNVILAVAAECPIPDPALDTTIRTGVVDQVRVEFFDNPSCQFTPPKDSSLLFRSWDNWSDYPGVHKLYLGIPISPTIAPEGGYIPPNELVYHVLPYLKKSPVYGGIMVFPYLHHEVNFQSMLRSYARAA